jgi:hypothetical protein
MDRRALIAGTLALLAAPVAGEAQPAELPCGFAGGLEVLRPQLSHVPNTRCGGNGVEN